MRSFLHPRWEQPFFSAWWHCATPLKNGLWFSRWTPNLAFGYGLPFFNFREQASYYIPELLILLGTDVSVAMNAVYAASLVLGGLGLLAAGARSLAQ